MDTTIQAIINEDAGNVEFDATLVPTCDVDGKPYKVKDKLKPKIRRATPRKPQLKNKTRMNKSGLGNNKSINKSMAMKATLKANNKHLAKTLEIVKQDLALQAQANLDSQQANQNLQLQLNKYREVALIKNENVEKIVCDRVKKRYEDIKMMLLKVSSRMMSAVEMLSNTLDMCSNPTRQSLDALCALPGNSILMDGTVLDNEDLLAQSKMMPNVNVRKRTGNSPTIKSMVGFTESTPVFESASSAIKGLISGPMRVAKSVSGVEDDIEDEMSLIAEQSVFMDTLDIPFTDEEVLNLGLDRISEGPEIRRRSTRSSRRTASFLDRRTLDVINRPNSRQSSTRSKDRMLKVTDNQPIVESDDQSQDCEKARRLTRSKTRASTASIDLQQKDADVLAPSLKTQTSRRGTFDVMDTVLAEKLKQCEDTSKDTGMVTAKEDNDMEPGETMEATHIEETDMSLTCVLDPTIIAEVNKIPADSDVSADEMTDEEVSNEIVDSEEVNLIEEYNCYNGSNEDRNEKVSCKGFSKVNGKENEMKQNQGIKGKDKISGPKSSDREISKKKKGKKSNKKNKSQPTTQDGGTDTDIVYGTEESDMEADGRTHYEINLSKPGKMSFKCGRKDGVSRLPVPTGKQSKSRSKQKALEAFNKRPREEGPKAVYDFSSPSDSKISYDDEAQEGKNQSHSARATEKSNGKETKSAPVTKVAARAKKGKHLSRNKQHERLNHIGRVMLLSNPEDSTASQDEPTADGLPLVTNTTTWAWDDVPIRTTSKQDNNEVFYDAEDHVEPQQADVHTSITLPNDISSTQLKEQADESTTCTVTSMDTTVVHPNQTSAMAMLDRSEYEESPVQIKKTKSKKKIAIQSDSDEEPSVCSKKDKSKKIKETSPLAIEDTDVDEDDTLTPDTQCTIANARDNVLKVTYVATDNKKDETMCEEIEQDKIDRRQTFIAVKSNVSKKANTNPGGKDSVDAQSSKTSDSGKVPSQHNEVVDTQQLSELDNSGKKRKKSERRETYVAKKHKPINSAEAFDENEKSRKLKASGDGRKNSSRRETYVSTKNICVEDVLEEVLDVEENSLEDLFSSEQEENKENGLNTVVEPETKVDDDNRDTAETTLVACAEVSLKDEDEPKSSKKGKKSRKEKYRAMVKRLTIDPTKLLRQLELDGSVEEVVEESSQKKKGRPRKDSKRRDRKHNKSKEQADENKDCLEQPSQEQDITKEMGPSDHQKISVDYEDIFQIDSDDENVEVWDIGQDSSIKKKPKKKKKHENRDESNERDVPERTRKVNQEVKKVKSSKKKRAANEVGESNKENKQDEDETNQQNQGHEKKKRKERVTETEERLDDDEVKRPRRAASKNIDFREPSISTKLRRGDNHTSSMLPEKDIQMMDKKTKKKSVRDITRKSIKKEKLGDVDGDMD